MRLPAQVALLVACLAAPILVSQAQEEPMLLRSAPWTTESGEPWRAYDDPPPNATYAWDGRPLVVAQPMPLLYDATRDATLAGVFVCSHDPCGPLLWIRGNVTADGPVLLRPSEPVLRIEALRPPPAPPQPSSPAQEGPPSPTPFPSPTPWSQGADLGRGWPWRDVDTAVAQPFEASPALPVALGGAALRVAPLLLLAAVPGRAAPRWQHALVAGAVLGGAGLAYATHEDPWAGLAYGGWLVLGAIVGALWLLVEGVFHRRIAVLGVAGLALAFAFFAASSILSAYAPSGGFGD